MSLPRSSSGILGVRSSWGWRAAKSVIILVSWVTKLRSLASSRLSTPFLTTKFSSLGRVRRPSGESPSLPASSCASRSSRRTMLRQLRGCLVPRILQELMEGEQRRAWDEGKQKEQARRQLDLQDNVGHYAASLVQRISDPSRKERQTKELSKKIGHEIESNICSICLQLMIPPLHNPVILFPCGHNICKDCLFERPPQGPLKKNLKLKLEKCSLCRQKIASYAVNQSLMTLICTYSNNKHLIDEEQRYMEQQQEEEEQEGQNYERLKMRCAILEKELGSLSGENQQLGRSRVVMGEVVETLKREKRKAEREMEKVEEEGRLINKCLSHKVEEMQCLEKQLKEAQDRSRVIDKSLQPLLKEKERQQLLLMQRLISKK